MQWLALASDSSSLEANEPIQVKKEIWRPSLGGGWMSTVDELPTLGLWSHYGFDQLLRNKQSGGNDSERSQLGRMNSDAQGQVAHS